MPYVRKQALNKPRREVELMIRRYTALLQDQDESDAADPEPLPEAES